MLLFEITHLLRETFADGYKHREAGRLFVEKKRRLLSIVRYRYVQYRISCYACCCSTVQVLVD
jgi:hypothetical protein